MQSANIVKRAKWFFGTYLSLLIAVVLFTLVLAYSTGTISKLVYNVKNNFRFNFDYALDIVLPTPDPTYSPKYTAKPEQNPKTLAPTQKAVRACFRYSVTHLDGSTSNLCYSKADYISLTNLGYNYSSAKTFYEFHLNGAADYQSQYDRTKSAIYLDAKASQEAEAAKEKAKMDAIIGQMQEVEKRGY